MTYAVWHPFGLADPSFSNYPAACRRLDAICEQFTAAGVDVTRKRRGFALIFGWAFVVIRIQD